MRILLILLSLGAALYGFFRFSDTRPEVKTKIHELLNTGSFNTLEERYSANQIMDAQRKRLLKDGRHRYLDPVIKFYPYLLMEVKYAVSNRKTKESVILWDLSDGEMVLNTKDWEKTHGFGDCINARINRSEFRIIHTLAAKGGATDKETLSKALRTENEALDSWVESCRHKKLIVQTGNRYRLHLEKPLLCAIPSTTVEERLVTKPHRNTERISNRFSQSQIEELARAAFGADFAVRKTADLYLPVHCISVQNPDGSVHTSYWNALNGKQMHSLSID